MKPVKFVFYNGWWIALLCVVIMLEPGVACEQAPAPVRTIVTAAHLAPLEGYTKVFEDAESDYAVYVRDDYEASACAVGDRVCVASTEGTVSRVGSREFSVVVDDVSKIVPGVSGLSVYFEKRAIGFISGWDGGGALRCIFY